jgi:transcriptional regulator with XRE-family HTH domain
MVKMFGAERVFIVIGTGSGKTAEIMRKILTAKTVTKMLRDTDKTPEPPSLASYLDELRKERGLKKEEFFSLSGISTAYGYEILRGAKTPSRDTLIQVAFGLHMDVEKTEELLAIGEKAGLYHLLRRDKLIIYALSHGFTAAEFNIAAEENGILPIGNY